ncbi:helix-turn-helix domain-containing protein [Gordonia sp. NPDC003424]
MSEQRRIGYHWNLRQRMADHNLWKTTELIPLLKLRGINLSNAQVHRLVTGTPERIPARTFAALCDILECTPNDLFEPYVEIRAAATAEAPANPAELGIGEKRSVARRIRVVRTDDDDGKTT